MEPQDHQLQITIAGITLSPEKQTIKSRELTGYSITNSGANTIWTLNSIKDTLKYRVLTLPAEKNAKGMRLVIDYGFGSIASAARSEPVLPQSKPATPTPNKIANGKTLRVVIDPGHGGVDPGMVGYITEKETTLAVAQRLRDLLESKGIEVIMTRDSDTQLSTNKSDDLSQRARMANAGTINAFISIHVNAAGPSAQGIETYYFGKPLEKSARSLAILENGGGAEGEKLTQQASIVANNLIGDLLAQSNLAFSNQLANTVQRKLIASTKAVNRGVQRDYFYVIRYARTPAILVEIGFGTHPVEGRKLGTDAYRQSLAQAIADGVLDFLRVSTP